MQGSASSTTALALGTGAEPVWRVDPFERLRREFAARGVRDIRRDPEALPGGKSPVVAARLDIVYDPILIRALVETPGLALMATDHDEVVAVNAPAGAVAALAEKLASGRLTAEAAHRSGLVPRSADEASGSYRSALRKTEAPYLLRVDSAGRRVLERRLFGGAYKGVTDLVTKYLWPVPAFWATQACVRLGLTPNMITFASLVMVVAAFWLFAQGQFAAGLAAAWLMTFLDTVDGKLARVTVTHTRLGNLLDHGIDLIHPPFWYWAWTIGLETVGSSPAGSGFMLAVIVVGYVLQRMEEGFFIARHGIEMHVWRPFDSRFRLITARRNPNLLILTAAVLAGGPYIGLVAVAWWTAICLGVHTLQLVQAEIARRSAPLKSWLDR